MKIELRNIHEYDQLTRRSIAFTAELYIDEIRAGSVSNEGNSKTNHIKGIDEQGAALIRKADEWCTSPPLKIIETAYLPGFEFIPEMSLSSYLDKLLLVHYTLNVFEKENQRVVEKANLTKQHRLKRKARI